jgi:adenosylmethionine-8-amino-7-oxononanoate aminotransferase
LLNVEPDIMVLGKGLTSWYAAAAATLVSPAVAEAVDAFCARNGDFPHALTTGVHPVALNVALRLTQLLTGEGGLLTRMRGSISHFQRRLAGLASYSVVQLTDGVGLGGSVHLKSPPAGTHVEHGHDLSFAVAQDCRRQGVFVHGQHGALIFAPPFVSTTSDLDRLFDCLAAALERASTAPAYS